MVYRMLERRLLSIIEERPLVITTHAFRTTMLDIETLAALVEGI
jgi:hypothetical protein